MSTAVRQTRCQVNKEDIFIVDQLLELSIDLFAPLANTLIGIRCVRHNNHFSRRELSSQFFNDLLVTPQDIGCRWGGVSIH